MDLIIASGNQGKLGEYRDILSPLGFTVLSPKEKGIFAETEETGDSFNENAFLKAKAVHDLTGGWVLADDSGLEVPSLGGAPGIYSARYLGLETEHERRLAVLRGLEGKGDRSARFVCCICVIDPDGETHFFTGIWQGRIAEKEEGSNGFGYDPIFISEDSGGRTTASLPITFKESMSHRAKALEKLLEYLRKDDDPREPV